MEPAPQSRPTRRIRRGIRTSSPGLGARAFVFVTFTSIVQSIGRGDAEIGLSGIEDAPALRSTMTVTLPYYAFREVLAVRDADAARFRTMKDLAGRRVATLGATLAYEILLRAEREYGITAVSYEDDVHPYEDLVNGRVDACCSTTFWRSGGREPSRVHGAARVWPWTCRRAVRANASLRDRCNEILEAAMRDGTIERILRKWQVWNDDQPPLHAASSPAASRAVVVSTPATPCPAVAMGRGRGRLPSLLRASLICHQMRSCRVVLLAVALGRGSPRRQQCHRPRASYRVNRARRERPFWQSCSCSTTALRRPFLLPPLAQRSQCARTRRVKADLSLGTRSHRWPAGGRAGLPSQVAILRLIRGPQAFSSPRPMTNDFVARSRGSHR